MAMIDLFPALNRPYDKKKLQQSRLQLLTEIRQLWGMKEPSTDDLDDIRTKMAYHNSIVDIINGPEVTARLYPIHKLPPELFTQVLREVSFEGFVVDTLNPPKCRWNTKVLFRLTLVSQSWKSFITSTPSFWTYIILSEYRSNRASTCLQLSRQLPISLHIIYSVTMETSTIWQEMSKNRDRIVSVIYEDKLGRREGDRQGDPESRFRSCMKGLPLLPALEILKFPDFYSVSSDLQYALDLYPTLREVYGCQLEENHIQCLMSRYSPCITIRKNFKSLWPLLASNPLLKDVKCLFYLRECDTSPIVPGPLDWRRLSVTLINLPFSIGITEQLTQLVELNVRGYFATLFQLFKNIYRLSQLQKLKIELLIDNPMMVPQDLPVSFSSNAAVEIFDLYLRFISKGELDSLDDDDESESSEEEDLPIEPAEKQKIEEFVAMMIKSLPVIRDLRLSIDDLPGVSTLGG
ncbi:12358_t:CDS:1, partial [Acaulospora colombiana]